MNNIVDKIITGAEKALDKGKAKVGELQIEMKMDGLAKKVGYLILDEHRERSVDQDEKQRLLSELVGLEDQLIQARAEAAEKAQATPPAADESEPEAPETPQN